MEVSFNYYLNDNILTEVFAYLDPGNLLVVSGVCQQWYKVRHSDVIEKMYQDKITAYGRNHLTSYEEVFIINISYNSLYPGIEEYLDIFHCLGRAIIQSHHPAVAYFERKITKDNLDLVELGTLFDLLANHWDAEIFMILIRRYHLNFRFNFHEALLEKINPNLYKCLLNDLPPLNTSQRGKSLYQHRLHFIDNTPNFNEMSRHQLLCLGRKEAIWSLKRFAGDPHPKCNSEYSLEINRSLETL